MTTTLSDMRSSEAGAEDVTAIWGRCHGHLRPFDDALPLDGCDSSIKLFAHVRIGPKEWLEMAQIVYERTSGRFLFTEVDRRSALGSRTDLLDTPVEAIDARLWFRTPTMINIEPTTRCNFNCWYCVGRHMAQEDIRLEDFARMLDNFPGVKTIALVGEGEPLLHKDFFAMAQMAKDRNIRVMIISNGSALSESVVKKLCETEVAYVSISVDSFDPAAFASSRIDGNLEKVWQGIRRLRKYRDSNGFHFPKIALKGTLFSNTIDHLPTIVNHAKSNGVEIFESFQALNPMHSYVRIYPREKLSELRAVVEVGKAIKRDSAYGRQELQPMEAFNESNNIEVFHPVTSNPLRNNCDETWLYSLLSGDVTPCCQLKKPISPKWNVFTNTVDSILADIEYENLRFNLWNGIFPTYCSGCWKTGAVPENQTDPAKQSSQLEI